MQIQALPKNIEILIYIYIQQLQIIHDMASIDYSQFSNNVYGDTEISVTLSRNFICMITNRIFWNPNKIDETEFSEMNKGLWTVLITHPAGDFFCATVNLDYLRLDVDHLYGITNDCTSKSEKYELTHFGWILLHPKICTDGEFHGIKLHRLS